MRALLTLLCPALLLMLSCASVKQFYPDSYFPQDRVYRNRPLGFAISYIGNWTLATDPADMNPSGRKVAKMLNEAGGELLFVGATVEGTQGTRGIAEHLNLSNEEYLAQIRESNEGAIQKDYGSTMFVANEVVALKWEYLYRGLRFVEFLFVNNTYNIRIAFWTEPTLYERFLPVYEDIMMSLEPVGRL